MLRALTFFCFFCILTQAAFAQPDTVRIGVYVNDVYDVNLGEQSFSTQFWVWFNYTDTLLKPLETLELPNAKSVEYSLEFAEMKKGIMWAGKRATAVMKKQWDIRRFPFDVQKMSIELEESDRDVSELVYVPDIANSKIDPQLSLANWEIERFDMTVTEKKYDTSYGDPELDQGSTYSRATFNLYIKRKTWGLFFALFTGMYVAFLISWLVFFIDPIEVDPRFGLSVGGLFAAVGNKYIVDSILPQSTAFTLVDKLHILTFFFLLMCIVFSVMSLRIWKNGQEKVSAAFDKKASRVIIAMYVTANLWLIWSAWKG